MKYSLLYQPEMLLIVRALLRALDGDAEDGGAARGVGVHVGGPHAPVLVTWPALHVSWVSHGRPKLLKFLLDSSC